MTDLTRETVSIADDYFRPVGVVGVSALEVRSRLVADLAMKDTTGSCRPIAGPNNIRGPVIIFEAHKSYCFWDVSPSLVK